ncbi:MAG: ABC transporter ATP-binding protein [Eubacteriales bacterium]|nr:ABC transporter ATP-binding protein [Eubacteriales bacterium]
MLKLIDVTAGYDELKVLNKINLDVEKGEIVALVGSNGAGKTTTLRAISNLIPISGGRIEWFGKDISQLPGYKRPELGIAHILQGRGILNTLTVKDNLILGAYVNCSKNERNNRMESVVSLFPILGSRINSLANSLSGGQQQMLAIARALMMQPQLLMLDEPSLGLAPILVDEVFHKITELRKQGVSILLVEQNLTKALNIADRGYVMETGKIVIVGSGKEILANPKVKQAYLGI